MSVLGLRDRMMAGASRPRKDAARALDSVPGSEDSGLTWTSSVALDGCSAASRTSMGPDTEASASISPLTDMRIRCEATYLGTYQTQTALTHLPFQASRKRYSKALNLRFPDHQLARQASRPLHCSGLENRCKPGHLSRFCDMM